MRHEPVDQLRALLNRLDDNSIHAGSELPLILLGDLPYAFQRIGATSEHKLL